MSYLCDAVALKFEVQDKYHGANAYFQTARRRGMLARIWSLFSGQPNNLMDVATITQGQRLRNSRHLGLKTIRISEICGSEGRCQDFDRYFNPLKTHNRERWNGIAAAYQRRVHFPAVDLIKIGAAYVVRDGHHRISVTKAMGGEFVDAHVIEWVLE